VNGKHSYIEEILVFSLLEESGELATHEMDLEIEGSEGREKHPGFLFLQWSLVLLVRSDCLVNEFAFVFGLLFLLLIPIFSDIIELFLVFFESIEFELPKLSCFQSLDIVLNMIFADIGTLLFKG